MYAYDSKCLDMYVHVLVLGYKPIRYEFLSQWMLIHSSMVTTCVASVMFACVLSCDVSVSQ